jgi:hypothetical protein
MSQPVSFEIKKAIHHVQSDAQGRFVCPCPYHQDGSNTEYLSRTDFVEHIRLVQQANQFTFLDRHLLETPVLAQYGLTVNTQHHILLCLSCSSAVIPSQLQSHLSKQHQIKFNNADRLAVVQLLSLCRVKLTLLPELHRSIISEIEGLPIFEGFPCPKCPTTAGTHESLKAHMRSSHKGTAYPPKTDRVFVQQLNKGSYNQHIRINVPEDLPIKFTSADILVQAMEMLNAASSIPTAEPSKDPRSFCPWLRRVRWQDLTHGKDINKLVALVEHPKPEEFPYLADGLLFLFRSATPLFDSTSELILQRLNTPKPVDE